MDGAFVGGGFCAKRKGEYYLSCVLLSDRYLRRHYNSFLCTMMLHFLRLQTLHRMAQTS